MNHERWDQIWIFLSLDFSIILRSELLLPGVFGSEQQLAIRRGLRERVLEAEPYEQGIMKLFKAVDPGVSSSAEALFQWGEQIFLFEGPDRMAETIWRVASYWMENHRVSIAEEWVSELMGLLRTDQKSQHFLYQKKITEIRSTGIPD